MNILRVGDPHVRPTNLEESERLLQFVLDTARAYSVFRIEILGDLFHTHAILRLEVLEFWKRWLKILSDEFQTVVLVGNHDQSGNHHSDSHALSVFIGLNNALMIIEQPEAYGPIGYMPYIHDNAQFISQANALADRGVKFLVSHTTYAGSKYDNGMYAPDGVDPDLIDARILTLLSGHVHAEQQYGRVIYPGTARWDTASDANKRKGIWLYKHDPISAAILEASFISTEKVCVPLIELSWREGDPQPNLVEGARVHVELIGSSAWISQQKGILKGKCSIRTKITDSKHLESRKATASLQEYIENQYVTTADKEGLLKLAKEIGLV